MIFNKTQLDVFLEVFPEFVESINLAIISRGEFSIIFFLIILIFREKFFFIFRLRIESNQKIYSFTE
jgi:hypothetical protein